MTKTSKITSFVKFLIYDFSFWQNFTGKKNTNDYHLCMFLSQEGLALSFLRFFRAGRLLAFLWPSLLSSGVTVPAINFYWNFLKNSLPM